MGAILTQQTTWANVTKAIANLKERKLLDVTSLSGIELIKLEEIIKPAGYFRQKARRLKGVCDYLVENYGGDLKRLFSRPLLELREELLSLSGLGPETVDSILLYAGEKLVFPIDAYTKRIVHRLGITRLDNYEDLRGYFEENLPQDLRIWQEFHALIVRLAKSFCKVKPVCEACPLIEECGFAKSEKREDIVSKR